MATTKKTVTKKPAPKKSVKKAVEIAAPAGIQDGAQATETMQALNKLLMAFAAERGLKITKRGNAVFSKNTGRLTLPAYTLSNPAPVIAKGTRVAVTPKGSDVAEEGEVTKIEGKVALVLLDGTKKPVRFSMKELTVIAAAKQASRKNVLPTLAQGVKVEPGKEYAVKGGGYAVLEAMRQGRALMWVIQVNRADKKGLVTFGIYGSARKGDEGDVNRRYAEQQLRKICAGVKGAKKTNPNA